MFVILFCIIFSYIPAMNFMEMMSKNANNYGPYKMTQVTTEQCRGPKSINLTKMTCALVAQEDNTTIGIFHYDFDVPAKFEEVKLSVYRMKNGKKITLWNHKITEPCKHFLLGVLLKTHLRAENCLVKKGKYKFIVNITEMTLKFYGLSFFYGDYIFKAVANSKKGNVGCVIFRQVFEKDE